MKQGRVCVLLALAGVLAGCSSSGHRAPIVDKSESGKKTTTVAAAETNQKKRAHEKDWRPEVHVVQKGDTLYSIAFNYGFDYHELAELNGIKDPSKISIGQEIRLFPGRQPTVNSAVGGVAKAADPVVKEQPIKEQPKLVKYAYSDAAVAQAEKIQEAPKVPAEVVTPPAVTTADNGGDADEPEEGELNWAMPTQGKVIAGFSEPAKRKGIDISGTLGQPVVASAAGKVVYSGSGLRGYGKLIIIKHNKTYLSAYAHNDKLLVKEGQAVARGQKIATMGNTDADQVKLHFEVRRLGKPVDPAKFLPIGKS